MSANRVSSADKRACDFTAAEADHVRNALRFLRLRCGNWAAVGKALGYKETSIIDAVNGRVQPSASMAIRIAKLAKVPIDDVINGRYPEAGTCPMCGAHRVITEDMEV